MPAFSYYSESDAMRPTGNDEIDGLLQEVRSITGLDWRIDWREEYRRAWYGKRYSVRTYDLIVESSAPEFQLLNIGNTLQNVANYLFGVHAGYHAAMRGRQPTGDRERGAK